MTVTLHGLSHTSPSDLDVLLVGPGGQTVDGTARAGTDFVAVRGTLTFAPGVVRRTILVPVVGDRAAEPLEQMRVVLSGASVGLADPVGIGTILNDD